MVVESANIGEAIGGFNDGPGPGVDDFGLNVLGKYLFQISF